MVHFPASYVSLLKYHHWTTFFAAGPMWKSSRTERDRQGQGVHGVHGQIFRKLEPDDITPKLLYRLGGIFRCFRIFQSCWYSTLPRYHGFSLAFEYDRIGFFSQSHRIFIHTKPPAARKKKQSTPKTKIARQISATITSCSYFRMASRLQFAQVSSKVFPTTRCWNLSSSHQAISHHFPIASLIASVRWVFEGPGMCNFFCATVQCN